ncbi:MAG TPA: 16S rRNA (cytosine(1402)-N(4))-methyltransferase RsmH, partial [Candidatus Omnitrophota bacterium]|nr:16S rRNA (cytosine(1402)-N(4))-methyltransferase RsmH [Candidatus Omnitrophota bacterium]
MKFNFNIFGGSDTASAALIDVSPMEEEGDTMTGENLIHKPVMFKEALSMLNLKDGMIVLDATLGLGGHSAGIAEKIMPGGRLIGIDKDEEALNIARENLKPFSKRANFVHEDFRNLDKVLESCGVAGVDAVLFDLGVSSLQLDNAGRGFSFRSEGPLDMRMDRNSFISAYDLLNTLTEDEISSILWRFGQERFSYRIAREVVRTRQKAPLSST